MRITYIADAVIPSTGANCVQTLQMNAAIAALGHRTCLLSRWHAGRVRGSQGIGAMCADFGIAPSFRLRYLPFFRLERRFGASYFWVAAIVARSMRTDLVITRTVRIAKACTRLGLRVLVELHTPPNSEAGWQAIRRLASNDRLLRWVFISERLRQIVTQRVPLPLDKVLVAHDAVDLRPFRPALSQADARLRVSAGAGPLIVYAGSLYEGRGGEELVDVAAEIPSAQFWLIGGQPMDVERIRRHATLRGATNVNLIGHVPSSRLPPYFFAADVLVIPTTLEGRAVDRRTVHVDYSSPMKLFEYMAAGRPIVATRLAGLCEVLKDEEHGLLVEPGDSGALKNAIERVLGDRGLAERLAHAAGQASLNHTWERRARLMLADLEPA